MFFFFLIIIVIIIANICYYSIENSCNVKYTKNSIFDCWYHQKKTWFDLIPIQEINDSDSSSGISELNWITYKNKRNCIRYISFFG